MSIRIEKPHVPKAFHEIMGGDAYAIHSGKITVHQAGQKPLGSPDLSGGEPFEDWQWEARKLYIGGRRPQGFLVGFSDERQTCSGSSKTIPVRR